MPGEIIGYTCERLLKEGALDVFLIPIQMKKFRPGVILGVLCRNRDREKLERIIFFETRTFGIRRHRVERTEAKREWRTLTFDGNEVSQKIGSGVGVGPFSSVEYEDAARIAGATGFPLFEVYERARRAAE